MQTYPIGNLTYFALANKTHLSCKPKRADKSPQKHIYWFNRQLMQITHAALYKHLAQLISDSSQLCIYMTSPHILAPNVWKCYQDYFQSTTIHSYPSTSSIVYYYTKVLLWRNYFHWSVYRKRAELHKVTLTFTCMHQISLTFEDADIHSAQCNWEGSGHEIWPLKHWGIYIDWCVLFLFLLLLLLNVVVHLWLWINNYSWTRTTMTLHSNNNMNLNKKIAQFINIDVLLLLLLGNFVLVHM